uniref:ATP-dependent RNA helicase n=1 Tax=Lepeophtheirus salmonis TaxID=72036 RepID=C1BU77_LEPSM|nr:ATP-dependent RNA helicase DBP4 [Lepeophtheirus salmonis]
MKDKENIKRNKKQDNLQDTSDTEKQNKKNKNIYKKNSNSIKDQKSDDLKNENEITFDDFIIHKTLKENLKKNNFENPTEIQKKTIPAILESHDVISIAKTGSGKTICFVVPIISRILENFNEDDKLSALIITPTRELAVQTYELIKKLTVNTKIKSFNVIGGIKFKKETYHVEAAHILICTPGRLLQHFSELPNLRTELLDVLVLDEFDKMIELGFKEAIKDIIEYLPDTQRVLLSATFKHCNFSQEIVKLTDPKIFSDFSKNDVTNFYKILKSTEKINYLYSLLSHISKSDNRKVIVFFSTCKGAKFHYLLFSKFFKDTFMLSSSVKQQSRLKNYSQFRDMMSGILFCTDLAARGLDFPNVSTVIQFDCPDTPETYIHRIGRTARIGKSGSSFIFLLEKEERLLNFLENINLEKSEIQQTKIELAEIEKFGIRRLDTKLNGIFRNDRELKLFASKYRVTYKKVLMLNNKKFKVDVEEEISQLRKYLGVYD